MTQKEINLILSDPVNDEVLLHGFQHACDTALTDTTKQTARRLNKKYTGKEAADSSRASVLMTGFLMGFREGLRLSAALDEEMDF